MIDQSKNNIMKITSNGGPKKFKKKMYTVKSKRPKADRRNIQLSDDASEGNVANIGKDRDKSKFKKSGVGKVVKDPGTGMKTRYSLTTSKGKKTGTGVMKKVQTGSHTEYDAKATVGDYVTRGTAQTKDKRYSGGDKNPTNVKQKSKGDRYIAHSKEKLDALEASGDKYATIEKGMRGAAAKGKTEWTDERSGLKYKVGNKAKGVTVKTTPRQVKDYESKEIETYTPGKTVVKKNVAIKGKGKPKKALNVVDDSTNEYQRGLKGRAVKTGDSLRKRRKLILKK